MAALWLIIQREFVSNVLTSRFMIGFIVCLMSTADSEVNAVLQACMKLPLYFLSLFCLRDECAGIMNTPQVTLGMGSERCLGKAGAVKPFLWMGQPQVHLRFLSFRLADVSFAGERQTLATARLREHLSAVGKLTTTWGDLKVQE